MFMFVLFSNYLLILHDDGADDDAVVLIVVVGLRLLKWLMK